MEDFLDKMRFQPARNPFPLLNCSRRDLHWTLLISIVCLYIAVVVYAGQDPNAKEHQVWKALLVICGSIGGISFLVLSTCKICCGYGGPFDALESPAYESLEQQGDARGEAAAVGSLDPALVSVTRQPAASAKPSARSFTVRHHLLRMP